ncbi:MAG TPA: hypothetical protein VJN94_17120 [Candidatus Binataceae bacterium]|nr:hypothetical protein [Candidatus Binataceae bacterium]
MRCLNRTSAAQPGLEVQKRATGYRDREGWPVLLAIALVAVILRLGLIFSGSTERAFDPSGDSAAYVELAQGLRHGCGFARLRNGSCTGAEVDRTPGYPLFIAAFPNLRSVLIAQAIVGAVIVLVVGWFVMVNWGVAAAIVSSTLVALDIPSIVYSAELMTETIFTSCFVLGTIIALYALNGARREAMSRPLLILFAAALFGFGILTRPIGEFVLPVAAVLVLIVGSRPLRQKIALQLLLLSLPLVVIAGWAARNDRVAGVAAPSSVGAVNLFYYRGGGTLAFLSGGKWFGALKQIGSRPQNELTGSAFSIIEHHPVAFAEMTAWSLLFVSLAPLRTPLSHILGIQSSFPIEDPGSMRLREALSGIWASPRAAFTAIYRTEFNSSPTMAMLTILQIALVVVLWVGVAASLRLVSTRSYQGACLLIFAGTAFVLLLLAAGPEGTARLRIPAQPFLAALSGIGWVSIGQAILPAHWVVAPRRF